MYHIARSVTRRLAVGAQACRDAVRDPLAMLGRLVEAERARLFLWAPVLAGIGVAAYFGLRFEPEPAPVLAVVLVGLFAAWHLRMTALRFPALGLALLLAGFALAVVRTAMIAAPILPAEVGPALITGTVEYRETLEDGDRLTIRPDGIGRLRPADLPRRVRVSVRTHGETARAGDRVSVLAVVAPPSSPVEPGAFDFQRHAFYRGLGGYGYAVGPVRVEARGDGGLAGLRESLAQVVRDGIDGGAGPIAAALLTGDRSGIAQADVQALRDSGLAHLLAISGLHMGLVAGFLFFAVRFALALWPRVALTWPIRKWAALVALAGGLFYLLLTGGSVPTVRAYIMIALVMLAILTDRRALSLRTVAIAALVVLALTPEAVVEPGFQMSFAAVTALVATYERLGHRLRPAGGRRGDWLARTGRYVAGVALTTLIAGLATAPYAIFHFNRVADYGLPANLVAIPVVAFWVMPAGTLAMVLVPSGLQDLPLWLMGLGIEVVLDVAHGVAGLPGAVRLVPAMPVWGLLVATLGGLWLCLAGGRRAAAGVVLVAAGMASPWLAEHPVIRVDGAGNLMAVRSDDGGLMLSSTRRERFTAAQWLARDGLAGPQRWPGSGASADGRLRCDSLGCIWRSAGWMVALSQDPRGVEEDCRRADVVIATVPVAGRCPSARLVVDRFDLWRDGPHALYLSRDGPRIRSVNADRGYRPWVRQPLARADQYWRNSTAVEP